MTSLLLVAVKFLFNLSSCLGTVVLQVVQGIWPPFVFLLSHELGNIARHDCHSVFRHECICVLYQPTRLGLFFQPLLCGRGCLEGGQGNICVLQGRKQEPNIQFSLCRCDQRGMLTPFFSEHSDIWG